MSSEVDLMKANVVRKNKLNYLTFNKLIPWLMVIPGITFTVWFKYYPIVSSAYMSFFDYDVIKPPGVFVGLQNFSAIFKEAFYWDAWKNTLAFLMLSLAMCFVIPLLQAIFLNEITRGQKWFSAVYLLPAFIPGTVNIILWKWIWDPDYGIANLITKAIGLGTFRWLSDPHFTKFCIVFPGVLGGGITVLLYLGAIQTIPEEIYESAALDGCTGWSKVFRIILPNIRFMVLIQLMFAVITAMQTLDNAYQFTQGGPNGAATSMGIYIYNAANQDVMYGKASAASIILFAVIFVISFVQIKLNKQED